MKKGYEHKLIKKTGTQGEYAEIIEKSNDLKDKLFGSLNKEQKEQLKTFLSVNEEIYCVKLVRKFNEGFRLGAKMMVDVYKDEIFSEEE